MLDGYTVVHMRYRGPLNLYPHRTLKAAARRMASCISGKLSAPDTSHVYAFEPSGKAISLAEAREKLAAD